MEASVAHLHGAWVRIASTLSSAGIDLDGPAPHDIRVRDSRFFRRVATRGSLGFGESYVDGDWESNLGHAPGPQDGHG